MHAEAEITFDCSKCGQHLSVDASGAGHTVNCPVCRESLIVPQEDVLTRIAAITYAAPGFEPPGRRPQEHVPDATDSEASVLREQLVDTVRLRCRMERDLMAARTEMESAQAQLRRATEENNRLMSRQDQLEARRREMEKALSELRMQHEKLTSDTATRDTALAERAETLRETQWALEKSEKRNLGLTQEVTRLREEVQQLRERTVVMESLERELAMLRKDFEASADAQECNRLRARAEAADEKRRLLTRELEDLREETAALRRELSESHERYMAAEQRAEQLSIAKVQSDNEVLRALLARQKGELENCYRELKRFRRSELGLRLVYALFALGLLGIAAFAVQVLPGIADVL